MHEYVSECTSAIFVWCVADFCKCSDPYAAYNSCYKEKKKIGAVNAAPISAIKLPVADFRRQLTQGMIQLVSLLTIATAFVLAETAWTMTAI